MAICCCTLAGTNACIGCRNNERRDKVSTDYVVTDSTDNHVTINNDELMRSKINETNIQKWKNEHGFYYIVE